MSRHRVPMLTASRHAYPDPAISPDPAVRRLVAVLATVEVAPPPTPEFTAELRAQLVAVAPRLVADGTADPTADLEPCPTAGLAGSPRVHRPAARWPRVVGFAVSALAVLVVLLGGLVWISRSALPGDALYGLKRTAETIQLALTSGGEAKGRLELHFADVRTDEVARLIARPSALGAGIQADAPISPSTATLVRSTLASADADVVTATRLLTEAAMHAHTTAPLKILTQWASAQRHRLYGIADRLPPGPLRNRALLSATVVNTAQQRAVQVSQAVQCRCGQTQGSDSFGPVPCTACPTSSASSSAPSASAGSSPPAAVVPGASSSVPAAPPADPTTQQPYLPSDSPVGGAPQTGQDGGSQPPAVPVPSDPLPSDPLPSDPLPSGSDPSLPGTDAPTLPSTDPPTQPSTDPATVPSTDSDTPTPSDPSSSPVPSSMPADPTTSPVPSSIPAPSPSDSLTSDPVPSFSD